MSSEQGKADLYSSDSAEDSERERMHRTNKGHLGKMARRRLEAGLRAMTGEREQIARLMEFAVNHADAVDDVSGNDRNAGRGRSDRADWRVTR
jgi:U2-associated protein SR140